MNLRKCQKYLTTIIKDKQDLEKKVDNQKKEIDRINNQYRDQEKKIAELERKLREEKLRQEATQSRKNKAKKKNKSKV